MIANGEKILRLNTGNPAEFGFTAPDEVIRDLIKMCIRDRFCILTKFSISTATLFSLVCFQAFEGQAES